MAPIASSDTEYTDFKAAHTKEQSVGLEEFKKPEVNEYGPKGLLVLKPPLVVIKKSVNKIEKPVRKNNDAPIIEDWVSDDEDELSHLDQLLILSGQGDLMLLSPQHVGFGDPSNPMVHHCNSQLNDKGFVDSGCSRHMTGNITHLSDFKDFDGGYVYFGWQEHGGRNYWKGIIKTISDFDDVYFVKELKFNLFSVSQMCDKKNYVLFTDSEWKKKQFSMHAMDTEKVLHVKPHNKTPYELFRGFKPAIGFMKPFGCHVTILNTLDNLGKFDGKSDEGIQGVSESSTSSQQDQDNQDCIIMLIWKDASYFGDAAPRSVADAQIQDKDRLHDENDASEKSPNDSSLKNNGTAVQQRKDLVGPSHASEDTQVEDQEVEIGNIPQTYTVLTTPHTRIHKIQHVIGDVQSSVQTRRMTTSYYEQGFLNLEKPLVQDGDAADVDEHLYRSMIGSLMYLTATQPDIMFAVCACARFQVSPKTSHLLAVKRIFRYLKGKPSLGLWYPKDSPLELVAYTDSDYAGATQDRKSTTGGCQFLGNRLISWQCKKQTVVATSTTEAEYVAAASCCGQVLWIQNQLLDYGYNFMNIVIYIDNRLICIIENPVQHSKTKHIEIRHHFIRDCNAKKLIQMAKIDTEHNVADLLTKGFDAGRFQYLVSSIGMLNP
ncbi:hypothetical protein Tco_1104699 [Tanacetum coccineum]